MYMTTNSFIYNPCDEEEDDMALVCCHDTKNGDLFLLGRFPDEDEVDITFRDDTVHVEQLKVTLTATLLKVEIAAAAAKPFGGEHLFEITHGTPAQELTELDATLRILLKQVGSYVSDLT